MVYSDWALIAATVAGPVFAVQAQKWVERARDRADRKRWIIYTLMATSNARLSQEHVRALNSIDLTFYGVHLVWFRWQRNKERVVVKRWHDYLVHLNSTRPIEVGDAQKAWDDIANDHFFNLLDALLTEQHFDFDLMQIKRGNYSPIAHWVADFQNVALRGSALEWLSGQRVVRVSVDAPQPPANAPITRSTAG